MRGKTASLARITLQSNFDSPRAKKKRRDGTGREAKATGLARRVVLGVAGVLIAAAALFVLYWIATRLYGGLEAAGGQEVFVDVIFVGIAVMVAGFGFMFFMQEMYYSADIPVFLSLPIQQSQILTFRFLKVTIWQGALVAVVVAPFLVAYGVETSPGWTFIPVAVVIVLFASVIPLTVIGLISMLAMRFTKGLKSKRAVPIVATVGGFIGVQFVLQSLIQSFNPGMMDWLAGLGEALEFVYVVFPGTGFAARALELSGADALANLGAFVAASGAAFGLFLVAGRFLYVDGLTGIGEEASDREAMTAGEIERATAVSSKRSAYMTKEFRQIRRSIPVFLNTVINPVLLFPALLVYGLRDIDTLLETFDIADGVLVAGATAIFAMFSMINPVFATVISREGSSLYVMKYLPMRIRSQLAAKVSVGLLLALAACVLIGTGAAVFGFPLEHLITAALVAVVVVLAVAMTGMVIDLKRPNLTWTNESGAIMGLNWVVQILAGAVYLAVIALPALLVWFFDLEGTPVETITHSAPVYACYIAGIFATVDLLLWRWLSRNARRLVLEAS